jgi:A/G-specific adenine glycosylase
VSRARKPRVSVAPGLAAKFSQSLRDWFRRNGRDLPWRRTRDPYRVLVSEAMLQQTQVSRVVDYYARFLERFPTLDALAKAPPRRVRESWEGLGYYARARNLHATARRVTELPAEPEQLRALPGIGPYTAGAVASFAFERRAALVDTNVARVLRRVFAPRADFKTARGQQRLWGIAESILPRTGKLAWAHNQAIMELGALVCTARIARCGECPVRQYCKSGNRELGTGNGNARHESARFSLDSPARRTVRMLGP